MSGVQIAQNLKRERVRIDANGNEIDPKTKEFIRPIEEPSYTPTPAELEAASSKKPPTEEEILAAKKEIKQGVIVVPNSTLKPVSTPTPSESGPLGDMITKKIEEKIGNAIADAIGKINLEKLVTDAIERNIK